MPATTIVDNGASIKITVGTQVRNIVKAQIVEITVIRTNIIKIDIGQGALDNVFIPYADVTVPSTADAEALRDVINTMLSPVLPVGNATEARQTEQIDILNTLNGYIQTMQNLVTALDNKIFHDPLLVDDSGAGIVYKGYAVVGSNQASLLWAIERIEKVGEIEIHTWADGNKQLDNRWTDRETLAYS